jgi:hypothetical protein
MASQKEIKELKELNKKLKKFPRSLIFPNFPSDQELDSFTHDQVHKLKNWLSSAIERENPVSTKPRDAITDSQESYLTSLLAKIQRHPNKPRKLPSASDIPKMNKNQAQQWIAQIKKALEGITPDQVRVLSDLLQDLKDAGMYDDFRGRYLDSHSERWLAELEPASLPATLADRYIGYARTYKRTHGMKSADLKQEITKLAHQKPELRKHLVPLIREAKAMDWYTEGTHNMDASILFEMERKSNGLWTSGRNKQRYYREALKQTDQGPFSYQGDENWSLAFDKSGGRPAKLIFVFDDLGITRQLLIQGNSVRTQWERRPETDDYDY